MESANQFIKRRSEVFQKNLDKYREKPKDCYLKCLPDINRKGKFCYLREAWTFMKQFNIDEKIFIVERLKRKKIIQPVTHKKLKLDEIQYRIGYYMVGKNGNRKNKWTWGESCPFIPKEDFNKLIEEAKKDKTIL